MKEFNANRYIGKTATTPRPTADDRAYQWSGGANDLKRDQERWDFAKSWDDDNATRRAEHMKSREVARAAWAAEANERFVAELREKYLAADPGASETDFQRDLPEIRRQHRIKAVLTPATAPMPSSRYSI